MRVDRVRFAAELARAEITLTELAQKAGLSRATVTAVRGGKSCSRDTAEKIASGLDISIEKLLIERTKEG